MQALPNEQPAFSHEYKDAQIKAYCAAGFTLFPCKVVNDQKVPKFTGWQKTEFDSKLTAADLPDIYGFLIPPTVAIIDYDPRRDPLVKEGTTQLKRLWDALGLQQPDTFAVRTGSGGLHIYYVVPEGVQFRGKDLPGFPGVEVKAFGRFVVGAGAMHPNGTQYKAVQGNHDRLEAMPAGLLELSKSVTLPTTGAEIETDDRDTQRIYVDFLRRAPAAVEKNGGSNITWWVAANGRDYGLSEEVTYELMSMHYNERCVPEWSEEDLRQHVANAYSFGKNTQGCKNAMSHFADFKPEQVPAATEATKMRWDYHYVTEDGAKHRVNEGTLKNVVNWFHLSAPGYDNPLLNLIRLNVFNRRIEFTRPAPWHKPDDGHKYWDDNDDINLKHFLVTGDNYKRGPLTGLSTSTCREAATKVAYDNQYHPIKEWLSDLKWDGQARLDRWLTTYGGAEDSRYVREVGKNTLIAAVARVFQPGCKHDSMLVLEGPQYLGKSAIISILGGEWAANVRLNVDTLNDEIRTVQAMLRGWILEAGEMAFTRKSQVESVKNFLSKSFDVVRLPYARDTIDVLRDSVFIGTYNPDGNGYLRDATGNRRFWPVELTSINLDALAADREQIFAEAVARYRNKEQWWITDAGILADAKAEQESRLEEHPFTEPIHNFLLRADSPAFNEILTVFTVAKYALNDPSPNDRTMKEIARVMRSLGYVKKQQRNPNDWKKYVWYWRKEGDTVAQNAERALLSQI